MQPHATSLTVPTGLDKARAAPVWAGAKRLPGGRDGMKKSSGGRFPSRMPARVGRTGWQALPVLAHGRRM